jgi:uncharacterized protein DUF6745
MMEIHKHEDAPLDPALRLVAGQEALTPAQEAEVQRFTDAYIQTQLSTEPVDEHVAQALVERAYALAGLAAPGQIEWLDGPRRLVERLFSSTEQGAPQVSAWPDLQERLAKSMFTSVGAEFDAVGQQVEAVVLDRIEARVRAGVGVPILSRLRDAAHKGAPDAARSDLWHRIQEYCEYLIWYDEDWDEWWHSDWERALGGFNDSGLGNVRSNRFLHVEGYDVRDFLWSSVRAYQDASWLASCLYFARYYAPNDATPLAQLNQLISGYWLGRDLALIVRRPQQLLLDTAGRLHSATGPSVRYGDGWTVHAWHGICVPERVISAPEQLTAQDWSGTRNVEVRRVIRERMGARFISEIGGVALDSGPRGTLYQVELPGDPEQVAHYVQVRDTSTEREYYLRVPPTISTAEAAVAWTFGLTAAEYQPEQES